MSSDELRQPDHLTPHPGDVAIQGDEAPACDNVEDLIKLLVTIHHRWGNTAVRYRVRWGASGLWAADEQASRIEDLEAKLKRSRKRVKQLREKLEDLT